MGGWLGVRKVAMIVLALLMVMPLPMAHASTENAGLSESYQFHFSSPTIALDTEERVFTLADTPMDPIAGAPSLPVESVLLALRPGHTLREVEVTRSSPSEIEIIRDYPRNPFESPAGQGTAAGEPIDREAWDLAGTYVLEGVEIVCLNLRPVVWDSSSGKVSFASDFTVTIVSEETSLAWLGDLDRVRDLVDNPEVVTDLSPIADEGVLPEASYEHLIITDETLTGPFLTLAEWKGERGDQGSDSENIASVVVTMQYILAQSSFWGIPTSHANTGNDTQTILRNFIKAAHREWGVNYVLIGGDEELIPSRKVYVSYSSYTDNLPADIYYTCLDGDWDSDLDGVYGEAIVDGTDLLAEVYVGRAPVSTNQEAWNFVNKTIEYENGYAEQYDVDLLFVGELLDSASDTYGDEYKIQVYDDVLADKGLNLTTLYARDGTFSASAFISAMNDSPHIINHMGHGNYGTFAGLTVSNAANLDNEDPFVVYTQACMVAGFDQGPNYPYDSIAEEFVKGENGAVAFIGNSRYGWFTPGSTDGSSQQYDLTFFGQVFDYNVTQLGRALSQSKQELVSSVYSANTMRWVYMELNLLGDPETSILKEGQLDHDLALQDLSGTAYVLGEEAEVDVLIKNLGRFTEVAKVSLLADDVLVDEMDLTLIPKESAWITLTWIPSVSRPYTLTAIVECSSDNNSTNDRVDEVVWVDQRISSYTLWENLHKELSGSLLIDPGATLDIRNCTIEFLYTGKESQVRTEGTFLVNNSSFSGSEYLFTSNGGVIHIRGSDLSGSSNDSQTVIDGGSLDIEGTVVHGGRGWVSNGANVTLSNIELLDQGSKWVFGNSSIVLADVTGEGGEGIWLTGSVGQISNLTWIDGSSGLVLESCNGLVLRDVELQGNDADLSISGTAEGHFLNDLERVNVTYGPVVILHQADDVTVEGDIGALYLVDCHGTVVKGLLLGGNGQGLTLFDCSGIEVVGNAIENCDVGIQSISSEALIWSNDLLSNSHQVQSTGSILTYGKEYPIGGNHWSNFITYDARSGAAQDESGADGIVDLAYEMNGVYDHYPKVSLCSIVYDMPEAAFSYRPSTIDTLATIAFTDDTQSGSGIANWTWDMGDGTVIYGDHADHRYDVKGPITVSLTVTDHKGSDNTISRDLVVVNYAPDCDFSFSPAQPMTGSTVTFTDHSSDPDGGVVTWLWNFGDGNTSVLVSPTHVFDRDGDYIVTLTVWDGDGDLDSMSVSVPIGNSAPTAAFSWSPDSVYSLDTVTFTDGSIDNDGSIGSWNWNFGDGKVGTGSIVTHRFAGPGTYRIALTVVDDDGASSTTYQNLIVLNALPEASFSCPGSVLSMTDVQFDDTSSDREGSITMWSWDFGDESGSTLPSPVHAYAVPGEYIVTLTVKDEDGAIQSVNRTLVVLNRPPETSMIIPEGDHWSLDVIELQATGNDLDGTVESFTWDFGDGATGHGETVEHAFSAPGNHTVTLTCFDDAGASTSVEATLVILNLLPSAEIIVEQGTGHPLEMVLTAVALDRDGNITNFAWSFGDGGSGEGRSVVHRYGSNGDYWLNLTVTDDSGGRTMSSTLITVHKVNVSLNDPHLILRDSTWVFSAEVTNEGEMPVNVTLIISAGGAEYRQELTVSAGDVRTIDVLLTGFEGGEVTASIEPPENWDIDPSDNVWTGSASSSDRTALWIIGAGIAVLAVVAVAAVVFLRRR